MRGDTFWSGFRSRMLGAGGSVASAKAAIVSMIRLTHSNYTAVKTDSSVSLDTAETNVRTIAIILTVT
jgi:hypothetical protein